MSYAIENTFPNKTIPSRHSALKYPVKLRNQNLKSESARYNLN